MSNNRITNRTFGSLQHHIQILGPYHKYHSSRANIYLGKLEDLSLVAVKELRGGCLTADEAAKLLYVYATRSQMYEHPNVDSVLGASSSSDRGPFVVSRHYSRGNFIEDLVANPRGSDQQLVDMIKGLIGGLRHIHDVVDIIHGNVHESNLLVDDSGEIMICDTAFASMLAIGWEATGAIPCNYRHMPHERLIPDEDDAALGPESKMADIYAIALCIIQMWTLKIPFFNLRNKYQVLAMLRKLRTRGIAGMERPASVPRYIWEAISDCLSVDPQDRPTASTLLGRF